MSRIEEIGRSGKQGYGRREMGKDWDHENRRVLASLIGDYLKKEKFRFTFPVFLTEVETKSELLDEAEISKYLRIEPEKGSSFIKDIVVKFLDKRNEIYLEEAQAKEDNKKILKEKEKKNRGEIRVKEIPISQFEDKEVKTEFSNQIQLENEIQFKIYKEVENFEIKTQEAQKYADLLEKYKNDHDAFYENELKKLKSKEKILFEKYEAKLNEAAIQEKELARIYEKSIEHNNKHCEELTKKLEAQQKEAENKHMFWENTVKKYEEKVSELLLLRRQIKADAYQDSLKSQIEFDQKIQEEKKKMTIENLGLESRKTVDKNQSDQGKKYQDQLMTSALKVKKLKIKNEDLKKKIQALESEVVQNKNLLENLNFSQRSAIKNISQLEIELKSKVDENESMNKYFVEQLDKLNKKKIESEIEIDRLKNELKGKNKEPVSDYLIERKFVWNKLQREEFFLKRGIMEMIRPEPVFHKPKSENPLQINPTTQQKPEKSKITKDIKVETQLLKFDQSSSSSTN